MAHEIETFYSARTTAWHGLGTVTPDALNSKDALHTAGLDWTVKRQPLFLADGTEVKTNFANVRETDNSILGVVGDRYEILQNVEAFDFADSLLQEGATYETAGSLFGGKKVFLCAKLRTEDILGDAVDSFLVIANTHDGSGCLKAMTTPVRVVCNNTLKMAQAQAMRCFNIRHTSGMRDKVEEARRVLSLADKYMFALKEEAERMVQLKITPRQVKALMDDLFQTAEGASKRTLTMMEPLKAYMDMALDAPDIQHFNGTAWGVYQALADFDSHRPVLRQTVNFKDGRFVDVVESDAWLAKATTKLLALAV